MDAVIIQQGKQGIMDEEEEKMGSFSSSSEDAGNSFMEDTSSSSSVASSFEMSSLKEQLPFKKGLSKYYQGKSQSFASFSDIRCFEDLVKPERPWKKIRMSKSCGDELDIKKMSPPPPKCGINKKVITKKASKGCFSSSITKSTYPVSPKQKLPSLLPASLTWTSGCAFTDLASFSFLKLN